MDAPLVVDIKRGSLDDGPGVRSVVFFKGCPLRCAWCQNPETLRPEAEVQRAPDRCLGCGGCAPACPVGRARPATQAEPERDCRLCGACVEACPAAARRIAGEVFAAGVLAERLLRDRVFWRRSGGGVTLSGGEPTLHPAFAGRLAATLRGEGAHVLLETCGHFRWSSVAEHLLPHLSTVYLDLKLADPEQHRRLTGQDNALIHDNLRRLAALPPSGVNPLGRPELLPRIPLIPGVTDGAANLRALAELCAGLGLRRIALLPYNPLWLPKRRALGLELTYTHADWMGAEDIARCRRVVAAAGVEVLAP